MWEYVIEGILVGIGLTVLLGPIFIALTQTSIEKGAKAGMTVGLGIWISDIIFIMTTCWFIHTISDTINDQIFKMGMSIVGGLVLIGFGIGSMVSKINLEEKDTRHSYKSYAGFLFKGFMVNTANPFTFVFWISIISTYSIGKKASLDELHTFLIAIMVTIIITDALKVLIAKLLRNYLRDGHVVWFSRVAGIGLCLFGLYLIGACLFG